ncbi:polysaccharide deacetylase family protein [Desulfotomaculum sp. 1211_IL3151]|uniref:polysaccharide deacetylase family protein n=1 Tax=Desulfotomaculum sp. 1211_IL3151 TaxID=3084055 RepID=UPI002FD8C30D
MPFNVFELVNIIIFFYMLLPTFLGRILRLGTYDRGSKHRDKVALTFDDGPDAYYTAQVLDILAHYNVKATFFLVGKYAENHPELIQRITAAGHSLGTHGYRHRFAWFQGPLAAIREISLGRRSIQSITNKRPQFFRPSWGVFNLATYLYILFTKDKTILWSFMTWDWDSKASPESIHRMVANKVKPGSIIVFHDHSAGFGAAPEGPARMVQALPMILQELRERTLEPINMEDFMRYQGPGLVKKNLRRLWQVWEMCFARMAGLKSAGNDEHVLFRLAVRNYRGKVMQLPDGTLLTPGDRVIELHLNNDFLQKLTTTGRSLEATAMALLRETRRSLPLLARAISQDPACQGTKALIGITMIHRGTSQLGFTVCDLSPFIRFMVAWYQRWLLFLLHPGGLSHLRRQWSKLVPKKVVISKQELLRRYL